MGFNFSNKYFPLETHNDRNFLDNWTRHKLSTISKDQFLLYRIFNEMEGNAASSKGTVKRKRGRPKKNTDTSAKNNNSVTFDLTEMNKDASKTLSPSVELPKKGENSDGTGRRTSTRVRTPRKNTFVYEEEDTTKNKRGNKRRKEDSEAGVSDNTPKKRGRKPKSSLVESRNVIEGPCKKHGRKRKGDTASYESDVVNVGNEKVRGIGNDKVDRGTNIVGDGEDNVHEGDVANEVDIVIEDGDGIDDENDDGDDDDSAGQESDDDDDDDDAEDRDNDDDDDFENDEESTKKKAKDTKKAGIVNL